MMMSRSSLYPALRGVHPVGGMSFAMPYLEMVSSSFSMVHSKPRRMSSLVSLITGHSIGFAFILACEGQRAWIPDSAQGVKAPEGQMPDAERTRGGTKGEYIDKLPRRGVRENRPSYCASGPLCPTRKQRSSRRGWSSVKRRVAD